MFLSFGCALRRGYMVVWSGLLKPQDECVHLLACKGMVRGEKN